ncbi:unnamed protein product [Rhizophagus irregularis]|nr:unnamed protein product [Rhizophagus irregularis]
MREQHPASDVGAFFCGPKPLGKQIHTKCNLWSQGFEDGTRFLLRKRKLLKIQFLKNVSFCCLNIIENRRISPHHNFYKLFF